MQTHGRWLFVGKLGDLTDDAPRFERQPTAEIEYPYRYCNKTLVVKFRGEGYVLGWWRKNKHDDHLHHVLKVIGRNMDFGFFKKTLTENTERKNTGAESEVQDCPQEIEDHASLGDPDVV
jgi:hypothetical protein